MSTNPYLFEDKPTKVGDAEDRLAALSATVEKHLPGIASRMEGWAKEASNICLMQSAFANLYEFEECTLLGMLIKYAGRYGLGVMIMPEKEGGPIGNSLPQATTVDKTSYGLVKH